MYYYHRDENGILKGKYDERLMKEISWNFNGSWQKYRTKEFETRCFVMEEDRVAVFQGGLMVIYFWKGDKLVEMQD